MKKDKIFGIIPSNQLLIYSILLVLLSGCSDDSSTPEIDPPVACFTTFTLFDDIFVAEYVGFSSSCSENSTSFAWDFGNGNSSTEEFPEHKYSSAGTYTVTLEVSDGTRTDQMSSEIIITDNISENTGELSNSSNQTTVPLSNAYLKNIDGIRHELVLYGGDMTIDENCATDCCLDCQSNAVELCLAGSGNAVHFVEIQGSGVNSILGTYENFPDDPTAQNLVLDCMVYLYDYSLEAQTGTRETCLSFGTDFNLRISKFQDIYVIEGRHSCAGGNAYKYRGTLETLTP